ncbi:hypothetical protein Pmani_024869 [Petrolisthes manimaculis]|uniref:HTH CENPB-type domain-containing protein n=2 Tax=Petrolisthes manimaculis TaxID=1843537 RepID=A0AAE1P959_9EUCA|nr:hypothetical protein Pmani_024869 [Petrolisthes manimaculis]
MGRKYKRVTIRERNASALNLAFVEVKEKGSTVRKAAKKFGVPRSTLMDYLSRDKTDGQGFKLASYSVRQVLSETMENDLAKYIEQCSKLFHGLTTTMTRRLAYEYGIANKVNVPDPWKRDKSAGKDWLTGFLERHSQLSLRTPEATSLARMTSFNRTNLGVFQKKLEEVLLRYQLTQSCIYNLDETGCTTVQKLPKVIAQKGSHQVGQVTSRERGELITMVGIICANGNALPPCFVFPRVRFDEARMMKGAPLGCKGLVHPSGWMTSSNFLYVLQHFVSHTRCSQEHKVLLIMDNHESHLSIDAINYAKENGIVLLTLPPHTSNKLQPLDKSVYGPFKTFFNQGLNAWMLQHPGQCATIYDMAPLMSSAWDRAATPVNIKAGFRSTGIHPFDIGVFSKEDFGGAFVTDRPMANSSQQSTSHKPDHARQQVQATSPDYEHPSESQSAMVPGIAMGVSPEVSMSTSTSEQPRRVSVEEIRPFPKAAARKGNSRGRRGKCMIVTDTPEKAEIEMKAKSKISKVKQVKKWLNLTADEDGTKRRRPTKKDKDKDGSSSEEEDILQSEKLLAAEFNKSSDFSEEDFDNVDIDFVDKIPEEGDFVLIGIDPLKGSKVHYVGQLISDMDDDDDEFQVSYLRKTMKSQGNCFLFPNTTDEASVHKDNVIGVLPKPIPQSMKRRQGYYNFSFGFAGYNMR